jgi:hypothetical protein
MIMMGWQLDRDLLPATNFALFRPQVDLALNKKLIRPYLKLNTFELKYTSVYHFLNLEYNQRLVH